MNTDEFTRACEHCGKTFELSTKSSKDRRRQRKYCSAKCHSDAVSALSKHSVKTCPSCGRDHRKATTLCAKCYHLAPREYYKADDTGDRRYSKHCIACGTVFYKPYSCSVREWDEQRKFCSRKCYAISQTHEPKTCKKCGKQIKSESPIAKFCSRECRNDSFRKPLPLCEMCGETCSKHNARFCSPGCKKEWYRGENVYNYAGGDAREIHNSSFWHTVAKQIRERDKVCQNCGAHPDQVGTLHVHHIVPYRISHDHSLENLVALCNPCHSKVETAWLKQNGYRNTKSTK